MIKVYHNGELALEITKYEIESFLLLRKLGIKPQHKYDISLTFAKSSNGFDVLKCYVGIIIAKDEDAYFISFLDLLSILKNYQEYIINWDEVKKYKLFWVVENSLVGIRDFDEIECKEYTEIPSEFVDIVNSVINKRKNKNRNRNRKKKKS
ncbi:MAG: hypothetical protein ABDH49_08460 [Candidatus Hydrothermales bacterium]